ncbi:MAG: Ig-like domain-containing protein [Bacteroidales bacterium]|nr:Ig-like domain-containing protein [Bacteroidales bacterium]
MSIVDGATETLTATTWPSGGTVTWTSSDENVATVSSGVVTAEGVGSCSITAATTYQGFTYSDSCNVVVTEE